MSFLFSFLQKFYLKLKKLRKWTNLNYLEYFRKSVKKFMNESMHLKFKLKS